VFNNLPVLIKRLYDNPTAFKLALKNFYVITLSIHYMNILIICDCSIFFVKLFQFFSKQEDDSNITYFC
jgi:hypothetical protein